MGLQTWTILSRTLCYFLIRTTSHQTNFNNNKTGQITKPDVISLTDNTSLKLSVFYTPGIIVYMYLHIKVVSHLTVTELLQLT